MAAIHKGKSGERELCKWLDDNFDLPNKPERNLDQTRSGGTDIILPPFAIEVKRREGIDLQSWWIQSKTAAKHLNLEPVVAFRQNRKPWEFLITAQHIGCKLGFLRVTESVFIEWAEGVWTGDDP